MVCEKMESCLVVQMLQGTGRLSPAYVYGDRGNKCQRGRTERFVNEMERSIHIDAARISCSSSPHVTRLDFAAILAK